MRHGTGAGGGPSPRHMTGILAEVVFALGMALIGLLLSFLAGGGR